MKTFFSDIIPKIQLFSQKLDNLTLLTNQHWVMIDELNNDKIVYIFRTNNELLLSKNGKVEKAKWEYLGNNSLLIDTNEESFLFKHGFFDENILALKIDNKNEYMFLINENKYDGELNSIDRVIDFLTTKYVEPKTKKSIEETTGLRLSQPNVKKEIELFLSSHNTSEGLLEIEQTHELYLDIRPGRKAYLNGDQAPDGKYKIDFMFYVHIKDGKVFKMTLF